MNPIIPPIPALPQGDDKKNMEALLYEGQVNEHCRQEKFKKHKSWIALVLVWSVLIGIVFMSGVWLWHLITPWSWLNHDQLNRLETILFSGVISSLISPFIKRYF